MKFRIDFNRTLRLIDYYKTRFLDRGNRAVGAPSLPPFLRSTRSRADRARLICNLRGPSRVLPAASPLSRSRRAPRLNQKPHSSLV